MIDFNKQWPRSALSGLGVRTRRRGRELTKTFYGPVDLLVAAKDRAVVDIKHFAELDAEYTAPAVRLVKDGVWQVPRSQRPKGWEKYGVKEPK